MRTAFRLAVSALAVAAALPATESHADEQVDPRIRFDVEAIQPPIEGVTATAIAPAIAHLAPQIDLTNESGRDLTVLGEQGEPFLRVGPAGVFGNLRSPFLATALDPTAARVPSPGGPEPLWTRIAAGARARWFERRAAYQGHPDRTATDPNRAVVLTTWRIPIRFGETDAQIAGVVRRVPIRGSVVPAIRSVRPAAEGISVRVLSGPIPAIELRNASPSTVEIVGRDGRPFARVGPRGVEANVNSATYRDTRSLPEATSTAVEFRKQQDQPVLVWLERRAAAEAPEAVQQAARRLVLRTWTVPGTVDGEPFEIAGVTEWVPQAAAARAAPSGSSFPWGVAADVAGGVAAAGAIVAVLRRRGGSAT